MTVDEILSSPIFNNSGISQAVFGQKRIISDKEKEHRSNKWRKGDKERIAKYFSENFKINLEVT